MKASYVFKFLIIFAVVFLVAFLLNQKEVEKKNLALDVNKYVDLIDAPVFSGSFEEYEESKMSLADSRKVILFFNASWCATCSEFLEEIKNVKIPDNVLILSIDYDKNTELRKKYKIAFQHTFVEVNKTGQEIYRWSGGGIDRLKKELNIK